MSFFVRADDGTLVNLDHVKILWIEPRDGSHFVYADEHKLHDAGDYGDAARYVNDIAARANAPTLVSPGAQPARQVSHFGEARRR